MAEDRKALLVVYARALPALPEVIIMTVDIVWTHAWCTLGV